MRRMFFAAAAVQLFGLVRPLLGTAQYLASRSSLASQRESVIAAITQPEPSLGTVLRQRGSSLPSPERFEEVFGGLPRDGEG